MLWALDVRTGAAVLPPAVIGGIGYSNGQAFTFVPSIQNNRLGLASDGTNVRRGRPAGSFAAGPIHSFFTCSYNSVLGRCMLASGATATSSTTRQACAALTSTLHI